MNQTSRKKLGSDKLLGDILCSQQPSKKNIKNIDQASSTTRINEECGSRSDLYRKSSLRIRFNPSNVQKSSLSKENNSAGGSTQNQSNKEPIRFEKFFSTSGRNQQTQKVEANLPLSNCSSKMNTNINQKKGRHNSNTIQKNLSSLRARPNITKNKPNQQNSNNQGNNNNTAKISYFNYFIIKFRVFIKNKILVKYFCIIEIKILLHTE